VAKDVKYVYGVIASSETVHFGPVGIGGRGDDVYTVPYHDLAAVVSDCPPVDYKKLKDKEQLLHDLANHQAVIEGVMKRFTVLPIKFGTMVKDQDEVMSILRQGYFSLQEAYAALEGKVEVEVVATWEVSDVFQEISAEEGIAELKAKVESRSRLRGIPDRVKLGKMVFESLNRRREGYQNQVVGALAGCTLDLQKNSLMDDGMVLNVAFVLEEAQMEEFDRRLDELDEALNGRLNFRRVGPLPPYSFSTVEVRPISQNEVKKARKLLDLAGDAISLKEVKGAYYALAQEHHPDAQQGNGAGDERFAQIAAAHQLLSGYCLGQAAAAGIVARKEAESHRCSFSPAAISEGILVSITQAAGGTS